MSSDDFGSSQRGGLGSLLIPYPAPVRIYVPASKNQYLLQAYMQVVNDCNRIKAYRINSNFSLYAAFKICLEA